MMRGYVVRSRIWPPKHGERSGVLIGACGPPWPDWISAHVFMRVERSGALIGAGGRWQFDWPRVCP